jgi:enoyl-CoA hydratase/carnithine racemase
MSRENVVVERRGHVLSMELAREAKRNAFSVGMFEALGLAYAELDREPELRVGVLHGRGDHFTAGLDLAEWTAVFEGGAMPLAPGAIDPLGLATAPCRKPVVCAVQGICYTIGIELLLATDVRVAASDVRFGQIEIKRGIYPVGGATIRLPREIGWGNAMRWLLTADTFGADEAHRLGLVAEVTPPGQQSAAAFALAEAIAAQAPLGVMATLASSRLAIAGEERAAAARLLPDLRSLMGSDDVREGLQSFVERRAARFTGR